MTYSPESDAGTQAMDATPVAQDDGSGADQTVTDSSADAALPDAALPDAALPDAAPPGDAAPTDAAGGCDAGEILCGAVCANLQSDAKNCGSCGHSCAVGTSTPTCSSGMCGATFIGGQANANVVSMASDGTNVYWVDQSHGSVFQCSAKTIGSSITLTPTGGATNHLYGIAVSGTTVVFTAYSINGATADLWAATVSAANSATVVATIANVDTLDNGFVTMGVAFNRLSSSLQVGTMAIDGNMHLCTQQSASAWTCSVYAASPGYSGGEAWNLVFAGGSLYWAGNDTQGGTADAVLAKGPSGVVNLAMNEVNVEDLTTDGTNLYWATSSNLMKMAIPNLSGTTFPPATPIGSGLVSYFNPNLTGTASIASDGKYVYFASQIGANVGIYYVPVGGGVATELTPATKPAGVLSVNVSGAGEAILFSDSTGVSGGLPGIYKVAAPP